MSLPKSLPKHLNEKYRLPIEHPDYQYPPSKNPYWAKLNDQRQLVYSDQQTEAHRNQWKGTYQPPFDPSAELHVELGCNAGHVILEWASLHPKKAYIGIDWKFKSIHRAAEKAGKRSLKNVFFFRAHTERLQYMFAPGEIDFLYLFFPDPWPKKSHWKNRIIQPERLREFAKLMKPGGVFHIKTDHPGYFEWMLEAIEKCSDVWSTVEMSRDLHKGHPAPHRLDFPDVTLFEKLFIRDQIPIQSVKLQAKC